MCGNDELYTSLLSIIALHEFTLLTISELLEKISFLNNLVGSEKGVELHRYFLLDELYGSGDFNETKTFHEDIDRHYVNSVESLARLYRREQNFIKELHDKLSETRRSLEEARTRQTAGARLSPPKFPAELEDFTEGAPVGIYRIQSIHNISIESLARGQLGPHLSTSPHRMNWLDCLHIANKAKAKNDLAKTVEWIQMAFNLANTSADLELPDMKIGINLPPGTDIRTFLHNLLQESIRYHDNLALRHGKFSNSADEDAAVTRIVPFNKTLAEANGKKIRKWKKKFERFVEAFPMFEESSVETMHDRLAYEEKINQQCQDLPESPFIIRHGSHQCHHLHKSNPYLRLAPKMLEILAENPTVALFHSFLTAAECDSLREKGRDRMKATPLTVRKGYRNTKLDNYTDRRMSKIRYISHRKDHQARNINDKISRALDFDLNGEPIAAENYQLMNYGLGNDKLGAALDLV